MMPTYTDVYTTEIKGGGCRHWIADNAFDAVTMHQETYPGETVTDVYRDRGEFETTSPVTVGVTNIYVGADAVIRVRREYQEAVA